VSRSPEQRIEDIRLCCEKILRYTAGMSQERLEQDELVTDAVLRNIEIIGEATKNLPDDVRAEITGIEWKKIAGMRDWLSHVYYRVDPDIVWDVVETKIPELLRAIQGFKDKDQP
jgi:uncharacterized protein with HEPN domain